MFCSFEHVRIAGISACVPPDIVKIDDEAEYYGGSLKKVQRLKKAIGLDKRRICREGVTAADLCRQAAHDLLELTDTGSEEVDALLFLSQTPDYQMPATSCILQDQLGLPTSCAAMDLSQGCSGYVYGLWVASSLVASGSCKNVLLLVGDSFPPRNLKNRVVAPIFGDGGSATLLTREEKTPKMYFDLGTDGAGYECIIKAAGRARRPPSLEPAKDAVLYEEILDGAGNPWQMLQPFMDGKAIFDFSQKVVPPHLRQLMEKTCLGPEDINYLFLHQANKQIVELVAEKAGFAPGMADSTAFSEYGNLACASIPVSICHRLGGTTIENAKMLLSGFGVGLSWASCIASMAGMKIATVSDYRDNDKALTNAEFEDYWHDKFASANKE